MVKSLDQNADENMSVLGTEQGQTVHNLTCGLIKVRRGKSKYQISYFYNFLNFMFCNALVDMQPHLVTCLPNFEKSKVKENALVDHHTGRQSDKSIRINSLATASYNHGQTSWDTFAFVGIVFNSHMTNPPPHYKQRCTCVSRIFFPSFNIVQGARRENFNKVSKRMHCMFCQGSQKLQKTIHWGSVYLVVNVLGVCEVFFMCI